MSETHIETFCLKCRIQFVFFSFRYHPCHISGHFKQPVHFKCPHIYIFKLCLYLHYTVHCLIILPVIFGGDDICIHTVLTFECEKGDIITTHHITDEGYILRRDTVHAFLYSHRTGMLVHHVSKNLLYSNLYHFKLM